jgi:hypothetical protein
MVEIIIGKECEVIYAIFYVTGKTDFSVIVGCCITDVASAGAPNLTIN